MIPSASIGSFTGFKAHDFVAHTSKTNCVAVGPRSGQVLATGGDDKRVNVWRIGRASSIWSLTGNSSAIESLRFDPTEEFLVSGSAGGAVKLFDLSAGKMTRHFRGHMSNVTVIDCGSFDRRFVTTGSMDCQVKLWNVETKQCAMGFKGHNAEITDVQFSPDGHILASAAADGQVKLWDLRAGKPMHTFQACSGTVRALRFNPQEFLLAVSTSDRTVKLYDIEFMELFCTTAPDTCQTRAITFDPDGQNMFCASPSGLRRWSWDNDTSTAKLGAMGDVAWGKVGAGALHYNADGQQLLAASCAGNRVSVWAVDFDTDPPPPAKQELRQQPGENGVNPFGSRGETRSHGPPEMAASIFSAASSASVLSSETAAATVAAAMATGRDTPASQVSVAATGSDSVGRGRGGLGKSPDDASGKPGSRSSGTSGGRERAREERARDSKRAEDKEVVEGSADSPVFQVLGRHLPLSTAADEKTSSPAATPGAGSATAAASPGPADACEANSSSVVAASGGTDRRSTRAAAVAAAVAAVASAKAAADDAVASVSSSGRHRSIGTSISDTLVITSSNRGGGVGRGCDDGGSTFAEGGGQQPGVCPGRAPGKEDGGVAREQEEAVGSSRHHHGGRLAGSDVEHKWHKRVTGAFACDSAGEKFGDRVGSGKAGARGNGAPSKQDTGRAVAEQGATSLATPSDLMINPWPQAARGGGGYRQALDGVEERGGGGDSPPLLGSPESPTPAARHGPPFPSARRSPDDSREEKPADVVARSIAGFPATSASGADGDLDLTPGLDPAGAPQEGDVWIADDGREGVRGELGMTRPRTATRRWDRPGPPGEDELIAQTLLSRASVTSSLSNRLTHLRVLRSSWADGDISGTISRLVRLENSATTSDASPRAVVADFLWVVPLEGARVTLEHCLELMPLLEDLWKLDAESSVAAGTRCLESVVRRFGGFVRSTLEASVAAGRVDLAREERMGRCREAHRAFIRGYHHLERAEREFYEDRRIAAVARRLRPLFESYFMS